MRQVTIMSATLVALASLVVVVVDAGGCTDFVIQTTEHDCNGGDGTDIYYTVEVVCSDTNKDFLWSNNDQWSAEPDLEAKFAGLDYPRPDYFNGQFNYDNSNPRLDFYRNGGGYNVYCPGGDGLVKTYAEDRDDLYDGLQFPWREWLLALGLCL